MKGKPPSSRLKFLAFLLLAMMLVMIMAPVALAAEGGGEANLVLPDLGKVTFMGMSGQTLLTLGLIIVALGLLFGVVIYTRSRSSRRTGP